MYLLTPRRLSDWESSIQSLWHDGVPADTPIPTCGRLIQRRSRPRHAWHARNMLCSHRLPPSSHHYPVSTLLSICPAECASPTGCECDGRASSHTSHPETHRGYLHVCSKKLDRPSSIQVLRVNNPILVIVMHFLFAWQALDDAIAGAGESPRFSSRQIKPGMQVAGALPAAVTGSCFKVSNSSPSYHTTKYRGV